MHIKQHLLDKRVVKRALQEGLLDKAQYQKTLDELPDLSHRIQSAADRAETVEQPDEVEADEVEADEVEADEPTPAEPAAPVSLDSPSTTQV